MRRAVTLVLLLAVSSAVAADGDTRRLRAPKLQRDDLVVYRYLRAPQAVVQYAIVKRDGGFVFDRPKRAGERSERDLRFACLSAPQQRRLRVLAARVGRNGSPVRGHALSDYAAHAMTFRAGREKRRVVAHRGHRRALRPAARRLLRKLHALQRTHARNSASLDGPPQPPGTHRCRPPGSSSDAVAARR
jgi:hypothetical protein